MPGNNRNALSNAAQTAATGGNSTGSNDERTSGNAIDDLVEHDQNDITPIITGRHVWAARRANSGPPGSAIPPWFLTTTCPSQGRTVPSSLLARFAANSSDGSASTERNKSLVALFAFRFDATLLKKASPTPRLWSPFREGSGRGRFVDIKTDAEHMPTLSEVHLVFNSTPLQRHMVGSILPETAMVVEITGFSTAVDLATTARLIAHSLRPFAQVHDIWMQQISFPDDPEPQDFNQLAAVVTTAAKGPEGGVDPANVHAIPGFIKINGKDCELSYVGRLDWCTTCGSSSQLYHDFDHCPRRRCFRCGEIGHSASSCTADLSSREAVDAMVTEQAAEEARGTLELDYGQA